MNLHKQQQDDEIYNSADFDAETENLELLCRRRKARKSIEEMLERKRLHDEIDELDGDFDWNELER